MAASEKGLHSSTCNPRGLNQGPRAPGEKGTILYFVSVVVFSHGVTCAGCWFPSLERQLLFLSGCLAMAVDGICSPCDWMVDGGNSSLSILQGSLLPSSELILTARNPSNSSIVSPRSEMKFVTLCLSQKEMPGIYLLGLV